MNENNVCSIKFYSKHSINTVLCLLRNLMEQTLLKIIDNLTTFFKFSDQKKQIETDIFMSKRQV